MNPQSQNDPAIDVPSTSSGVSEGPATHPPSGFHAPSQTASHYDMPVSTQNKLPAAPQIAPLAAVPTAQPAKPAKEEPISAADMLAQYNAPPDTRAEVAADDVDTSFDEEWVLKAQELVGRTKADPFLQSQEMGKLKAAYIKARYNKTIKVSE